MSILIAVVKSYIDVHPSMPLPGSAGVQESQGKRTKTSDWTEKRAKLK
jgi:hypothetical protein